MARSRAKSQAAAAMSACVLHGSWVPEETGGRFVFWAEVANGSRARRQGRHPFQLRRSELVAMVSTAVGRSVQAAVSAVPKGIWIALPGDGSRPAPSLELQAELDRDFTAPDSWGVWNVDAAAAPAPISVLALMRERAANGAGAVRFGHDLQFWSRLAGRLVRIVRRHEYLPAIHASSGATRTGRASKRRRTKVQFDVGWELADAVEADIVEPYSRSIPGVCRSVWAQRPKHQGGGPAMRDAHGLVRHFLEVQLEHAVRGSSFPQSAFGPIRDSLLVHGLPPPTGGDIPASGIDERTWAQWRLWRDRIQRGSGDVDEVICLRLTDAPADAPNAWHLEWLLSSRRDPSLLVPLRRFWARGKARGPAGQRIREVLLQLGQAARIYAKLWEGMRSDAPSGLTLNRSEALDFLRQHAPVLQGAGFRVIVPAWWTVSGQRRLRLQIRTRGARSSDSMGSASTGMLGFDSLVEFEPQVVLDGKPLTRAEWERVVKAKEGLVQLRGQWMELRSEEVSRLEEYWESGGALREMTVADLLRADADAARTGTQIVHEGAAGGMLSALRGVGGLEKLPQPARFVGELREYQLRGFRWLAYLERLGFGACLADDMGLGKTVQVIATMLRDRNTHPDGGPTLLVAPTSVLGNWQRETRRFAPDLATHIHHGPKRPRTRKALESAIRGADMVIVSFGVARLDAKFLKHVRWRRLVVDEAQNIKNPTAAVTKAVRGIRAARRVALTGTPVENRLMDLWSLFSFLNPGYLGTMTDFRKTVERPIMRNNDRDAAQRLRGMVRPFILRRMKTDKAIIRDLPEKVEQNSYCNLTPEQATLYEATVRDLEARLDDSEGIGRQGLMLSTLMRLKQICNHPAQFLQDGSQFSESRSHKLSRVCAMLDEIEAEGESALVFTQFTEIGKSLERLFRARYSGGIYYLHGGTPRTLREHMVEEFQNPDTERAIFVLSLRAGGTGITLTRANHVIHFDRWWNPAVENQATDRAYRIGQNKSVFVHKMVTMGTLEERIDALIESKKQLAEEIVGGDESWLASLSNDDFRKLISLDRGEAVTG